MRPLLTICVLAALSAGCEVETVRETTTPADTTSREDLEALAQVEAATPAFAPDFPGAQMSSVTTRTERKGRSFEASTESGLKSGAGSVTRMDSKSFTTAEPPEAVIEFYKKAAHAAGLNRQSETSNTDGGRSLEAGAGGRRLTVTAAPQGGRTSATVSYTVPS